MKILVIDGQGGKIGKLIIEQLKSGNIEAEIYAVGTNSAATAAMMKAGADYGATGENPIVVLSCDADIISGPIGIISADSLFGEITEKSAAAVGKSKAKKILIPVNRCNNIVVGVKDAPLSEYIKSAAEIIIGLANRSTPTV